MSNFSSPLLKSQFKPKSRPTWFQSVREASPIASGLYLLPLVLTISPSATVQSILVAKTGKYRLIVRRVSFLSFIRSRS